MVNHVYIFFSFLCTDGRKFSQPTATISKGGMATLLRSLSISGRPPGLVQPNPPLSQSQQAPCEGAGEGLGLSPPHTSSMTPVIADQATTSPSPHASTPSSPPSNYAEGNLLFKRHTYISLYQVIVKVRGNS